MEILISAIEHVVAVVYRARSIETIVSHGAAQDFHGLSVVVAEENVLYRTERLGEKSGAVGASAWFQELHRQIFSLLHRRAVERMIPYLSRSAWSIVAAFDRGSLFQSPS